MISVEEAETIIKSHVRQFDTMYVELTKCLNKILATDIYADRDYPPFDRVAMDGICIKYDNYRAGQRQFKVEGLQSAGSPAMSLKKPDTCFEIMTGSILSKGADTVIPYEQIERHGDSFRIKTNDIKPKSNIHNKGKDIALGTKLISANTKITPHTIAILATEGITNVLVYAYPKIAIVSTGDELVPIEENPKDYQIRTSNSYMIKAALENVGMQSELFHMVDDKTHLKEKMSKLIDDFDVIMLSGGVSKGKLDFIPDVLAELNVNKEFHRIAQRPGKPFWFGHKDSKLFFAFPGNPASSLLCYKKYFEYWLMLCLRQEPNYYKVKLKNSYTFKPQLTYFAQAKMIEGTLDRTVEILPGNGSGDIANFALIDGFVELPSNNIDHSCNDVYKFYRI